MMAEKASRRALMISLQSGDLITSPPSIIGLVE
jgi:hypothetical protein